MFMAPTGPPMALTPAWIGGPEVEQPTQLPALASRLQQAPWNQPTGSSIPSEPAAPPPKRARLFAEAAAEAEEGHWAKVFVDGVIHEAIMGSPILNRQARDALKGAPKHRACECASLRRASATNRV